MSGEMIRRRLVFTGLVQGVGFRWRALHAARAFGATGWVQNLRNGAVSMELQGGEEQIERVLQSLERGSYIRIESIEAREIPVEPEERGFAVKDDRI